MNILIPHTWLKEHLDTDATPSEIQNAVSLCGPSVERIYDIAGDQVYDIEITTNRVDSMSVRGVAREAAVILSQAGFKAELKPLETISSDRLKITSQLPLPKVTNNDNLCKRTMAVILSDVTRTPTPEWMATRLQQIEQNVHDSVIDITNYITHELGHPCHAFDYDKIMKLGGEIIITEAEKNEEFTTLDGESYQTIGGEVVFKNPVGEIIDLPAIKGTANTSIDESTTNVLLWIESVDPKKVRYASMSHAIRTVAAQLNEKNVDPALATPVLHRGIELYQDLCGAKVASDIWDDYPLPRKLKPVTFKRDTITRYLGLEIETNRLEKILTDLGFDVTINKESLTVTPPSFRPDVSIAADVIEEIARMYGYHNLPSTLMTGPIPTNGPEDTNFAIENKIKRFLSAVGLQELYTYSMVSPEIATKSGNQLSDHLAIANPLSEDRVYLRRTLLPSLEEVISTNSERPELTVFEIANTYQPQDGNLPLEQLQLAVCSNQDYQRTRGYLEALLDMLYVKQRTISQSLDRASGYNQSASISAQETGENTMLEIGTIGQLPSGMFGFEIQMENLLQVINSNPTYQPLPKTSPIIEDLTFTVPEKQLIGEVMTTIAEVDQLVNKVDLKDVYQRNFTFTIQYWQAKENLTAEDVTPIRQKIVNQVEAAHQAQLVGTI